MIPAAELRLLEGSSVSMALFMRFVSKTEKDDMGPALASQQKLAKVEVDINQPNPHHPMSMNANQIKNSTAAKAKVTNSHTVLTPSPSAASEDNTTKGAGRLVGVKDSTD